MLGKRAAPATVLNRRIRSCTFACCQLVWFPEQTLWSGPLLRPGVDSETEYTWLPWKPPRVLSEILFPRNSGRARCRLVYERRENTNECQHLALKKVTFASQSVNTSSFNLLLVWGGRPLCWCWLCSLSPEVPRPSLKHQSSIIKKKKNKKQRLFWGIKPNAAERQDANSTFFWDP